MYPLHGHAMLQTDKYTDIALQTKESHALIAYIMRDLRKAHPQQKIADPVYTLYNWSLDPYAQGAYPYRTMHINEKIQHALEQPEGNIYFAGSDFSRHGFSVHNGYANAKHVASQLINDIS